MPIPKTEAGKRKVIRSAMMKRPSKFPRNSAQSIAREALARKLMKQGHDSNSAYAIATTAIKRGMKRQRDNTSPKAYFKRQ